MQAQPTTYEAVPRYYRMPRAVLRDQLRVAVLALLDAGERVSVLRLRQCGIRGGTAQLIALRQELVATGELPPEAAARVYAPPKHPPGKASSVVHDPSRAAWSECDDHQASRLTPHAPTTPTKA